MQKEKGNDEEIEHQKNVPSTQKRCANGIDGILIGIMRITLSVKQQVHDGVIIILNGIVCFYVGAI